MHATLSGFVGVGFGTGRVWAGGALAADCQLQLAVVLDLGGCRDVGLAAHAGNGSLPSFSLPRLSLLHCTCTP